MIITESHLIFLANNIEYDPINIDIVSITEIWLKRYQHQENGLEFFFESNCSLFFVLQNNADRSVLVQYFADKIVQWYIHKDFFYLKMRINKICFSFIL